MLVTKEIDIDMGHRVPNHKSKCKTPHGHRYTIELGCDDKIIDESGASNEGMVIDFSDMKEVMMEIIDKPYDHCGTFWEGEPENVKEAIKIFYSNCPKEVIFVPFIPTAENLAKHWYELMEPELKKRGVKIKYVKVNETRTSSAIYEK